MTKPYNTLPRELYLVTCPHCLREMLAVLQEEER